MDSLQRETNGRSPKRLKQWDHDSLHGNGLLAEESTLPFSIPPSYPVHDLTSDAVDDIMSSSPPATVPTQLITTPQRNAPTSVVQVAASSPVIKESPLPPKPILKVIPVMPTPPPKSSYTVRIDLDNDTEVPYAGDSSDEDPNGSQERHENISATTFYQSRPKENSTNGSPNGIRIPESPAKKIDPRANMRSYAGQFTFNASQRPDYGKAAEDIRKMTAKHQKAQSRPLPPQRGPAVPPRSNGVVDISANGGVFERLKKEFPEMPSKEIVTSLQKWNHDYIRVKRALQRIQMQELGVDVANTLPRLVRVLPNITQDDITAALIKNGGSFDKTAEYFQNREVIDLVNDVEVAPTAKRNAQRGPTKTIREKFGNIGQTLKQSPIKTPISSPVKSEASPVVKRRRLVKGNKRARVESSSESEPEAIEIFSSGEESAHVEDIIEASSTEVAVLKYINTTDVAGLVDLSFTDEATAETILALRPFNDLSDIREIKAPGAANNKRSRPKPIGDKLVDQCIETWEGYLAVDSLLKECQNLGDRITRAMKNWGIDTSRIQGDGELQLVAPGESEQKNSVNMNGHSGLSQGMENLKMSQPSLLAEGVQLKPYQILGVNWLKLIYDEQLGGILADEMGLGKTIQVIAFLSLLLEKGREGPHLIVVPASTLENWLREFGKFASVLTVEPYYGSQVEKRAFREEHDPREPQFNVLITTYNMFQGTSHSNKLDLQFLREYKFDVAVFDEGHQLKNSGSNRANALKRMKTNFRLLLTGTPLQNNLQELINLLSFILPQTFGKDTEHLNVLFKYKATTSEGAGDSSKLLSRERVKRARSMMTPFVLRRKKKIVLSDLPQKHQEVIELDMPKPQAANYKKLLEDAAINIAKGDNKDKNRTNILMKLRQAAIHPLLARTIYSDEDIGMMAKAIKKEPYYSSPEHRVDFITEDMSVMTDFELDNLCREYPKTLSKFKLQNEEWMDAAKVIELKRILLNAKDNGDRVLVFSQFTLVLNILERVLETIQMPFLRLDGSTDVAERQDLIDKFDKEKDITAFLLTTKAGGVGLNLAAANKVIIFDSSFNPFDDLQAEDRAWRIGQTREVYVTRLVVKGTVEENIANLAKTKLMLDASISGEDVEAAGTRIASEIERDVFKQLFNTEA